MKKNVFTKNIRILIISLLILAVLVPKQYSQESMVVALCLWIAINIGIRIWNSKGIRMPQSPLNLNFNYPAKKDKPEMPKAPLPAEPEKEANPKKTFLFRNIVLIMTNFVNANRENGRKFLRKTAPPGCALQSGFYRCSFPLPGRWGVCPLKAAVSPGPAGMRGQR